MKKIIYSICTVLCAAAFAGCERNEDDRPQRQSDEMVAIELSVAGGSTQITRAGIDPTLTAIDSVTFIVFDAASSNAWLQTKTIDYAGGERLFLRAGGSYNIFAVANLDDSYCPNGDAGTYLNDVTTVAGLDSKYILAASALGSKQGKVPMITGTTATPLEQIVIPSPITVPTTSFELELRSLYTKVSVNIYNLTSGGGSGVTPGGYLTEDLPTASYLVEQTDDYAYLNTLYSRSAFTTPLPVAGGSYTFDQLPGKTYNKCSVDVYCLENRRGDGVLVDVYDRRDEAPAYATAIRILSTVTGRNDLLDTYLFPGKGRSVEANNPDVDKIYNYDIDRNSIYHINVIINGTADVTLDSRREYIEREVCGGIEDPDSGTGADF